MVFDEDGIEIGNFYVADAGTYSLPAIIDRPRWTVMLQPDPLPLFLWWNWNFCCYGSADDANYVK